MPRLLVFNPEHDYALAHGGGFYTAPASVRDLARQLQLLPLRWARQDDLILLADDSIASAANVSVPLHKEKAISMIEGVEPWGWDEALKHRLLSIGIDERLMPSSESIDTLRRLSHRRISIDCNRALEAPFIPQEFFDPEEALDFYLRNPGCWFKLPWSSGGRGVVSTSELNERQTSEWIHGAIRRQGSVMGEIGVERVLDFASLWTIADGNASFDGWSVSLCDGRGKYDGNISDSQENLLKKIREAAPYFSTDVAERQKRFIEKAIAPLYEGKMGIDMMADTKGHIYPCVEINLRRTMGHVAMDSFNRAIFVN